MNVNTKRGEDCPLTVYTEELIREICVMLEDGYRNRDILLRFPQIATKTPSNIRTGKCWVHVSKDYDMKVMRTRRFGEDTIRWVCRCLQDGMSLSEIRDKSTNKSLTYSSIRHISTRSTYKDISATYTF